MATAPLSNLTATWNASGTTFTAVKMNVTDTASAAGSLLIDLQTNGTSQFSVTKAGNASSQQLTVTGAAGVSAGTFGICRSVDNDRLIIAGGDTTSSTTGGARVVLNGDAHPSTPNVSFYDATTHVFRDATGGSAVSVGIGATDLILARDAANTLAQRNGTNAQAFRVYNTYTDASNFERVQLYTSGTFGGVGWTHNGTGSARNFQVSGNQLVLQTGASYTNRWIIDTNGHFLAATDNTVDIGASNANRPRNVHVAGYVSIGDGITAPGAGTGQARIYVDTADGDLKVIFADGTIKTIVTDT